MINVLWVALGGALGASARYAASLALQRPGSALPLATLAVNALGCLLAGACMSWSERHALAPSLRLFLLTGALGGFTTFSAFGVETLALQRSGRPGLALANVALQLLVGLGAVAAGWRLGSRA